MRLVPAGGDEPRVLSLFSSALVRPQLDRARLPFVSQESVVSLDINIKYF